jgi:hypothetical protein
VELEPNNEVGGGKYWYKLRISYIIVSLYLDTLLLGIKARSLETTPLIAVIQLSNRFEQTSL